MDTTVVWAVLGIVLIIIELATGTLYLLFLGVAALAAAAAAHFGTNLTVQVVLAAAVALSSLVWTKRHKRVRDQPAMPSIDSGQPVQFEQWIDETARRARVQYRGTQWDAIVTDDAPGRPGETFYIRAVHGNTLTIAQTRRPG